MKFIVSACLIALSCGAVSAADKPNVLIILGDDCTFSDLPMYGGKNAFTPNLEQLAADGLTFNNAYLTTAMCQPCRAELYSGQFPMRNGCSWNHSSSHPETLSMPDHLGALGYRVGLAGKVHVSPAKAFPFEKVAGFDASCVRSPTKTHSLDQCREFVTRDSETPFCLVVALVDPHVPWVMGDASAYPEDKVKLPPHIADTPLTRNAFSRYLAEITYMDDQIGQLLEMLSDSGHDTDTLVMFSSEQGAQFPGCKWTNWDTGVHTALIARWPGTIQPNQRTSAMVQYADVLPTLLDLAGDDSGYDQFDGTSFASVLRGESTTHRQFVYAAHNNVPEGPSYAIRSVSDGTYRYIRNLHSDNLYIEKHLMGIKGDGKLNNPYWQSWVWSATDDDQTYRLVQRYTMRPAEQLYHTASDRFEMENLAGSEAAEPIRQKLRTELDRWMAEQGDPGVALDTRTSHRAAKQGKHLYRAPKK